jgi:hypothetical protein
MDMQNELQAIVLGGTDDHIRLIEILKQRGYHTTLIDYFENPQPGPQRMRTSRKAHTIVRRCSKLRAI